MNEKSKRWSQLMVKTQQGDKESFRILLQEIKPSLTGFIKKKTTHAHDWEDIYQEVLMKIFAARHTYQPDLLFESWMFAIAKNTAIDHFRKMDRRKESGVEMIEEVAGGSFQHQGDVSLALKRVDEKLSPEQKRALSLVKIKGLSVKEAAKIENISTSALKVRVHRAYAVFKEFFS